MQYTSLQSKPYSNSRYFSFSICSLFWNNPRPLQAPDILIGGMDVKMINLNQLSCRPSSRNGKYTNGVANGGGYPGIQNMAYSPAYSNGVSVMQCVTVPKMLTDTDFFPVPNISDTDTEKLFKKLIVFTFTGDQHVNLTGTPSSCCLPTSCNSQVS